MASLTRWVSGLGGFGDDAELLADARRRRKAIGAKASRLTGCVDAARLHRAAQESAELWAADFQQLLSTDEASNLPFLMRWVRSGLGGLLALPHTYGEVSMMGVLCSTPVLRVHIKDADVGLRAESLERVEGMADVEKFVRVLGFGTTVSQIAGFRRPADAGDGYGAALDYGRSAARLARRLSSDPESCRALEQWGTSLVECEFYAGNLISIAGTHMNSSAIVLEGAGVMDRAHMPDDAAWVHSTLANRFEDLGLYAEAQTHVDLGCAALAALQPRTSSCASFQLQYNKALVLTAGSGRDLRWSPRDFDAAFDLMKRDAELVRKWAPASIIYGLDLGIKHAASHYRIALNRGGCDSAGLHPPFLKESGTLEFSNTVESLLAYQRSRGNMCCVCGCVTDKLFACNGACKLGTKRAFYCSTACQRAHWRDHKRDCRRVSEADAGAQ